MRIALLHLAGAAAAERADRSAMAEKLSRVQEARRTRDMGLEGVATPASQRPPRATKSSDRATDSQRSVAQRMRQLQEERKAPRRVRNYNRRE